MTAIKPFRTNSVSKSPTADRLSVPCSSYRKFIDVPLARPLVILGLCLLVACGRTSQDTPAFDLNQIYSDRESVEFREVINAHHNKVRRSLDELINRLVVAGAREDSLGYDAIKTQLDWLCEEYELITGQHDKALKLALYQRWSTGQAIEKLQLDSTFRYVDASYRGAIKDEPALSGDEFLAALHGLHSAYKALHDSFYVARVTYYVATTHENEGAIDSADSYFSRCRRTCRSLGYLDLEGECEFRLARILDTYRAEYGRAAAAWHQARQLYRKADMAGGVVRVDVALAVQAAQLYKSAQAIGMFGRALDGAIRVKDRQSKAFCLYSLAETYYDLGNLDSAVHFAEMSLKLNREMAEQEPRSMVFVGFDLSCLGLIFHAQGNYVKATWHFSAADAILQEITDDELLCTNNIRWAALLIDQGDFTAAGELNRVALAASSRFEDNLFALYGMAIADYFLGHHTSAKRHLHSCIERYERSRQSLPRPSAKVGMLSDKIGFYNLLTTIFLEEYQSTNRLESLDSAFCYLERSKAQSLLDMINTDNRALDDPLQGDLRERISGWENVLLLGTDDSTSALEYLRHLEDSLLALELGTVPDSSALERLASVPPVSLSEIQRGLLDSTTLLLEYMITDLGSCIFVVSKTEVLLRDIQADRSTLEELVGAYVHEIDHYPANDNSLPNWRVLGARLDSLLIPRDVIDRLASKKLLIVPAGRLHYLPFEALLGPDGHFTIEQFDVSYIPSMTVLSELQRPDRLHAHSGGMVAFGDPRFESARLDSLPFSGAELDSLESIFGRERTTLYRGSSATEKNFKKHQFGNVQFLHIATHGIADDYLPGRSAIIFAADSSDEFQGRLESSDIARMSLPVDLTFLSTCRSGSGVSFPGEGVLSLVQPFLVAGSQAVVVSYWDVFDRYSAELVPRFYRYHLDGHSKASSLAMAKRDLLHTKSGLSRHPYFWAPYVLVGADN